jgi:hypothetical protein
MFQECEQAIHLLKLKLLYSDWSLCIVGLGNVENTIFRKGSW